MPNRKGEAPRWFVPAVWCGMLLTVAALSGLAILFYDPQHETVAVGGRTYVVPPEHVSALTREPHLFIRIKPAGKPYEIVFDARAAGRRDGAGVPHIFSVNDHGGHGVWYSRDGRSLVVCRRASSPSAGCGTWIDYGGAVWSVLLPEARSGDADELARDATALLRRYDSRSPGLVS